MRQDNESTEPSPGIQLIHGLKETVNLNNKPLEVNLPVNLRCNPTFEPILSQPKLRNLGFAIKLEQTKQDSA